MYVKTGSILLSLILGLSSSLATAAGTLEEGMQAFNSFDYRKAEKILVPLAEEGNDVAQVAVGVLHIMGLGKLKQDNVQALKWFEKAAEQGNAEAGYYLGELYGTPKVGLQIDHAKAVTWYRWAAEKGQVNAQYKLASRYFKGGEGLPNDNVSAYAWMDLARRQGNHDAIENCTMLETILSTDELNRAKALADELAAKYIPKEPIPGIFERFFQLSAGK